MHPLVYAVPLVILFGMGRRRRPRPAPDTHQVPEGGGAAQEEHVVARFELPLTCEGLSGTIHVRVWEFGPGDYRVDYSDNGELWDPAYTPDGHIAIWASAAEAEATVREYLVPLVCAAITHDEGERPPSDGGGWDDATLPAPGDRPVCDPLGAVLPGYICAPAADGTYRLSPEANDLNWEPATLWYEEQIAEAVVTDWMENAPIDIGLCDGSVRYASGLSVSVWLTNLAYWMTYVGLRNRGCTGVPADLDPTPGSQLWNREKPFRDAWARLNELVKQTMDRHGVLDVEV